MKRFLAICLLVFAAAAVCRAQDISPNMTVKDLSGNPVLMKDVLKDDVLVVSFWATWCKPCQNELDALLAKSLNISSIPFVMIVADGKTVYSHTGYTPGSERLLVEKALSFIKK